MKWTKQRLNNLFFLLGIAAVVVMLLTFDVSFIELWQHLCHAGYWLIPIVGIWIVVYGLNAFAWKAIIEGNIGGKAPVSIFIYLGLVLIGDLPISTAIGITLGIIVVFCLIAFYLFQKGYRNGLVKYVLGVVSHIPGLKRWTLKFWARHSEAIQNVDQQIAALYNQDTKAFYKSLILEYLSRVVQSSEVMFMLLLFGIDCGGGLSGLTITFLHSILIVSFTTLFANLIGFLPMQLGVQEGGFVLSIAALGLSAALGIFVSIICRVREIIWIIIGIALMKIKK